MTNKTEPPICPGPELNTRKLSFPLPPGATDSHAHVFGQRTKYGYADDRQYTLKREHIGHQHSVLLSMRG